MSKIKIICTLGPKSYIPKIPQFKKENIDIFRINLSHTNDEDIEHTIKYLKRLKKLKIFV